MGTKDRSEEAVFETSDLNLASFLRCRAYGITDIRQEGENRTVFVFRATPDLHDAVLDYANDSQIGVRSFCSTLRDLKSLTRSKDRH